MDEMKLLEELGSGIKRLLSKQQTADSYRLQKLLHPSNSKKQIK